MKKVLVTGVAGFIGRNLAKELLEQEYEVVGIDNFSTGKEENIKELMNYLHFTFVELDITKLEELNNVFKTYSLDTVFHLAANPIIKETKEDPLGTHINNVNGTVNVLECSRLNGVRRLVFTSSSSLYGDIKVDKVSEYEELNLMNNYASQKRIGELYCESYYKVYGLETISLRLFNVYGPYQMFIGENAPFISKAITKIVDDEKLVIYGNGEQTRDFIYVSDVVKAFIRAAETNNNECFGNSFNIGTGVRTSVRRVAQEILIQTGKYIRKWEKLINWESKREDEPIDSCADIEYAEKVLEWKPVIDLTTGLKNTIEFYKGEK
jgi:nucleoside-diphosphate-sugar epimerase